MYIYIHIYIYIQLYIYISYIYIYIYIYMMSLCIIGSIDNLSLCSSFTRILQQKVGTMTLFFTISLVISYIVSCQHHMHVMFYDKVIVNYLVRTISKMNCIVIMVV